MVVAVVPCECGALQVVATYGRKKQCTRGRQGPVNQEDGREKERVKGNAQGRELQVRDFQSWPDEDHSGPPSWKIAGKKVIEGTLWMILDDLG